MTAFTTNVSRTTMDVSGWQSGGLEYDRILFNYEAASCCVGGTTRRAANKPFRIRARYNNVDTATVTKSLNVTAPGGVTGFEETLICGASPRPQLPSTRAVRSASASPAMTLTPPATRSGAVC